MVNYRVPIVSDMLDSYTMLFIMVYFFPYFIAGNADNYKEIANLCRPYK